MWNMCGWRLYFVVKVVPTVSPTVPFCSHFVEGFGRYIIRNKLLLRAECFNSPIYWMTFLSHMPHCGHPQLALSENRLNFSCIPKIKWRAIQFCTWCAHVLSWFPGLDCPAVCISYSCRWAPSFSRCVTSVLRLASFCLFPFLIFLFSWEREQRAGDNAE